MDSEPTVRRHIRVYYLYEEDAVELFSAVHKCGEGFLLAGLPEGSTIYSVHHCWERRAFGIVVMNPAFDPVEGGDVMPTGGRIDLQPRRHKPNGTIQTLEPDGSWRDRPSLL